MADSNNIFKLISKYAPHASLMIAWTATLGSLFFSEILKFPPCILCWYQRILMYPLVVIFTVGILRKDKKIYQFVLPFTIIGILIGTYHNLLYYNILPESVEPCTTGVSCTTQFLNWLGFITIPFLSLLAFITITFLMFVMLKSKTK